MDKRRWVQVLLFSMPPLMVVTAVLAQRPEAMMYDAPAIRSAPLPGQQIMAMPGVNLSCCVTQDEWGRCVRNKGRYNLFIKQTGHHPDLFANHIVPLRCGGCDVPSNMEWMTRAAWAGRTGAEAKDCGRHAGGEW